ncbi:MAG TPA: hypothetical protein VMW56_16745 [Candidatus Margulisiibacteriota bacterium]|nr:hypothetical protein [Candidatus Margulisiibacteriota bacterium]
MPDRLPEGDKPAPRSQVPVAEREPLTIIVVDTPPAEQVTSAPATTEVRQRTWAAVELYAEARRRRWILAVLAAVAGVLLLHTYRKVFEPVLVRFAHGIERRVLSEATYNALHERRARPAKLTHQEPHGKHERRRAKMASDVGR